MIVYLKETKAMAKQTFHSAKRLKHSKNKINKASKRIRKNEHNQDDINVIRDYRAHHAEPLAIITRMLQKKSTKLKENNDIIIAHRLKRLETIIDKLQRKTLDGKTRNTMKVTQMSDIAGCRVILTNYGQVLAFRDLLIKELSPTSSSPHLIVRERDYNKHMKSSGYSGIHLIVKTFEKENKHEYKSFDVEIQLRTKKQHMWATSVEIIDILESKSLKTNYDIDRDKRWREFFKLTGEIVIETDSKLEISKTTALKFIFFLSTLSYLGDFKIRVGFVLSTLTIAE